MPVPTWPRGLTGGCAESALLRGETPATLEFEPERWATLELSDAD